MNKPYNPYNLEPARQARQFAGVAGGAGIRFSQIRHRISTDYVKRNFQTYRPFITPSSRQLFWVSIAVTISFILSQAYLLLSK